MNFQTPLGRLRFLAILEGISYLLFAITMPLKYLMEIYQPNFYVGMAHGWLFVAYVLIAFHNIYIHKWNLTQSFLVLMASLVPLGTFVLDHKMLKPIQQRSKPVQ
ncbi:MAG: DUF3817 domain-containing protein [Reichenbachiella sp.]|uniref:DUF3817 domain-containing protein n=1 Tax=Reichenbachiella sp. TaxID=2184521 RepID=UPI003265DF69